MKKPELQKALESCYALHYVPAMAFAMVITQELDSALEATQYAMLKKVKGRRTGKPLYVFKRIADTAADIVGSMGFNPSGATARSGRPPAFGLTMSYRQNMAKDSTEPNLLKDFIQPVKDYRERMDPNDPDYVRAEDLDNWLSTFGAETKLTIILFEWLMRNDPKTEQKLVDDIANLIARPVSFIAALLSNYREKWKGTTDLTSMLRLWIDITGVPSVPEQIQTLAEKHASRW